MKSIKRYFSIFILAITVLVLILSQIWWRSRDLTLLYYYQLTEPTEAITSAAQLDEELSDYSTVSFKNLPHEFKESTLSNKAPYQSMLKKGEFYALNRKDLYRPLVGRFRWREFIPKDKYFKQSLYENDKTIYVLLDPKIVHGLLSLQQELEIKGLNKEGFVIVNGFRSPKYNEKVGGAPKSYHIKGCAIDLLIEDINLDGKITKEDKQLVLDILEKIIVQEKGGIGRYPGTYSIHFDFRGYRARWDKQ